MPAKTVVNTTTPPSESVHQFPEKGKTDESVSPSASIQSPTPEFDSNGPTPPPSGVASKSVPKPVAIEKMFETFHQSPNGDFKPTFYNPFEVKHRRRTSKSQFRVLERVFIENPKPTAEVRAALAQELNMTTRSIQVWFQNRRAKMKHQSKGKLPVQVNTCTESESSEAEYYDGTDEHNDIDSRAAYTGKRHFSCTTDKVTCSINESSKISVPGPDIMPNGAAFPNQQRSRSYSLPNLQRSPQLPFRQLQEALFGGSPGQTTTEVNNPAPTVNPTIPSVASIAAASAAAFASLSQPLPGAYYRYPYASAPAVAPAINPQQTYHVDPNRLRPRSSSFTLPRQVNTHARPTATAGGLASIAEQSPQAHLYPETNFLSAEEAALTAQMSSVDLEYYMALGQSAMSYNPLEFSSSASQSPVEGGYLLDPAELAFLPQPSNEILLSTLIDDKHFE